MGRCITAYKIFTGTEWLQNMAIVLEDGKIKNLVPADQVTTDEDYKDQIIVPAFIDLQVYGAASRLLAAYPDAATLDVMVSEFRKSGTVLHQPTLATNSVALFKKAIDAVRSYRQRGGKGVWGLHLEGPWINPIKRGAHVKEFIHAPSSDEVEELLEYGKDVITMITLAPEVCSEQIISRIQSAGIVVSAGHSNASYTEAMHSFDNGITAVTHLYNAMSGLHHREPGLVGAALHHASVCSSVIPDGHHVDYAALSIAKKLMGERLFAITDAVTETSEGYYKHTLNGDKYECNGTLSGSALSMHQAFINLVRHADIATDEALRMCSLYPARVIGCSDQYGIIAPGAVAEVVVLNRDLSYHTLINGQMA